MTNVDLIILLGSLSLGLLAGPEPARAAPATEPTRVGVGSLDPPAGPPPPPTDEPAATAGGLDPADDDPIIIDEPDKPWSKGVSREERIAAKELFLNGNELFLRMLFARSAEQYTAALAAWKHPAIFFNLAIAQLNLGKDIEARESLELALKYGQEPLGAKAFQEAQRQLQAVKRQIGWVRVTCRTPGAEVTLDGSLVLVGPGTYEGWVKAKRHDFTAKKPGYQAEARRVMIAGGERQELDLSLVTLAQAVDTTRRWTPWKPWAVIAAGSAIAITGGVFQAFSARNFNIYDQKFSGLPCARVHGCTAEEEAPLAGLRVRARRQQAIAFGSYALGGAVIATGAVLLYMNRPRLAEGVTGSVTVAPTLSSELLGIVVTASH